MTDRLVCAAMLVWAGCFGAQAGASEPRPLPARPGGHQDVEIVRMFVSIRVDPKRAAGDESCRSLRPEDLDVVVDGAPARVTDLEPLLPPTRHWLVFDTSQSAEPRRSLAKRSAREYLRAVAADASAELAVATIDEDLRLIVGPTRDVATIEAAIDGIRDGGQSFLRDGLDELLRVVASDRREHVILFWTDGDDASSLASPDDLRDTLASTPNVTIFPIVFRSREGTTRPVLPGAFLYDLARDSGGEVVSIAETRLADRIGEGLARRWVVVFDPPPVVRDGKIAIETPERRCRVQAIRNDAEGREDGPIVPPPNWERVARSGRRASPLTECDPRVIRDRCSLDVASDPGVLYDPRAYRSAEVFSPASFASRRWRVDAQPLDAAPVSPVALVDRVAALAPEIEREEERWHVRHPTLLHGKTFLVDRAKVAVAVEDLGEDYRDFARARIAERAEREIARIAERLRADFPTLSEVEARDAARASGSGRRLLEASRDPSGSDLGDILAAWLGDIPAREVFLEWERDALDALLSGSPRENAGAIWAAARAWLAIPRRARVLAPLVPIRDPRRDVVGFWRVVAPRPVRLLYRASGAKWDDVPDDLVPERPYALELLERLLEATPALRTRLAEEGFRPDLPRYESRDRVRRPDAERPYRRVRVDVGFSRLGTGAATLGLSAVLDVRNGAPEILELDVRGRGAGDLERTLREAAGRLVDLR